MIVVWLAFFPMNVLVTFLLSLIPGFNELLLPLGVALLATIAGRAAVLSTLRRAT